MTVYIIMAMTVYIIMDWMQFHFYHIMTYGLYVINCAIELCVEGGFLKLSCYYMQLLIQYITGTHPPTGSQHKPKSSNYDLCWRAALRATA